MEKLFYCCIWTKKHNESIIKHGETRSNRQGGKKKVEGAPKFTMEQLIWEVSCKSDWTELMLLDKACTESVQVAQGRKEDSKTVSSGKLV